VLDGAFRVKLICDAPVCAIETYAAVGRAFGPQRVSSTVIASPGSLAALCNNSCLRVVVDASVAQAARFQVALSSAEEEGR